MPPPAQQTSFPKENPVSVHWRSHRAIIAGIVQVCIKAGTVTTDDPYQQVNKEFMPDIWMVVIIMC